MLAWSRALHSPDLRCAKSNAALAALYSAGQFFDSARLKADILPSLIQSLLDFVGDVDDLRGGDDIVPPMNEAIENLVKPKAIFDFAIVVKISNFTPVQYLAFPSERCDGAQIRMHGGIDQAGVIIVALNIARTIKPIDS
jgi:hypothetical protein